MRILYVSGSSAGHLAPLVAVERAVKQAAPSAESLFVCSQADEDILFLRKEGVRYATLPLPRHPWRHPFALLRSLRTARDIVHVFKPDVVFSKGGIVSVPLCFVARRHRIPIVVHESDAVMGRANRLVAKWATKVCAGFPMKEDRRQKTEDSNKDCLLPTAYCPLAFTGNPIRPLVTNGSKENGLQLTGLSGKRPIMLIMGGSQGAKAINDAVEEQIDALMTMGDIAHITGRGKKTLIQRDGYWQKEFVHEELADLYAIADIAVSRAGAGSISELCANGIPSVLVPIEGLAHNHQVLNAITAQENGACILLLQGHLTPGLTEVVGDLLKNPRRRSEISQKARTFAKPDAAGQIAKIILQCVAQAGSSH